MESKTTSELSVSVFISPLHLVWEGVTHHFCLFKKELKTFV